MKSCKEAKEMILLMDEMKVNLEKWCEKGTKAAAKRARKQTILFEKLAKSFRKQSVQDAQ